MSNVKQLAADDAVRAFKREYDAVMHYTTQRFERTRRGTMSDTPLGVIEMIELQDMLGDDPHDVFGWLNEINELETGAAMDYLTALSEDVCSQKGARIFGQRMASRKRAA